MEERIGERSADYSTLCMTTMSEENKYASVLTDRNLPDDENDSKKEGKAAQIHWLAVFTLFVVLAIMIVLMVCQIAVLVELKAAANQLQESKLNS